ncbi:MAG: helix-hairpin-helix domain-containing protein [Clostridia bacterium]
MLDNLTKKQKIIVIAIAGIVVIGIMYFIYNKNQVKEDINIENEILVNNVITNENNTNDDIVIIHITGSVKNPGIVKLKEGSRIEDAIESAGGLTENADITKVNLAYVVEDGTKIKIPSASEEDIGDEDIIDSKSGDNIIIEENAVPSNNSTQTININKATEKEFETLPGIGPSLASKIIEYRNQNGKFESIEDIKNVNGIGDNKYEKIKDLITVK